MRGRAVIAVMALSLVLPMGLGAQQRGLTVGTLAVALSAERRGDLPRAAEGFFSLLAEQPGEQQAVLGLSRVLPSLDRRAELMAPLAVAIDHDSTNTRLLALAVRNWALLGNADSAAAYTVRWASLVPGEEEPFREWALAALEVRDRAAAHRALETGRQQIAHPAALAPEMAQLYQAEGNLAAAAQEWLRAVTNAPTYRASAVLLLGAALPAQHQAVLSSLADSDEDEARRLSGLLRIVWGDLDAGMTELSQVVPGSVEATTVMMQVVLDQLRNRRDTPALKARARAYEILASRQSGAARVTSWAAAARAWADAGDETQARALLAQVAGDAAAPEQVAVTAGHTLLGVVLAEGNVAAADSMFRDLAPRLTLDQRDDDRRRVAFAWALRNEFARAEQLMTTDSSIAGFDLRGRIHALAGDLGVAAEWLRLAGPYGDDRARVVERVRLLTLIKAIDRDTLPQFGQALGALHRGDTTTAVTLFAAVADSVAPAGGAALRLFAGDLALAQGDSTRALDLAVAADDDSAAASAPAARLLQARILAARNDSAEAMRMLESLILDFPDSAVVPEARRMRDLLRGALPPAAQQ